MNWERAVEMLWSPEQLRGEDAQTFVREIGRCLKVDRPCLVFDCSQVRQMDKSGMYLLLCCLEEAMKRNGDVKLAAISPEAEATLKSVGLDLIFEISLGITEAEKLSPLHIPGNSIAECAGYLTCAVRVECPIFCADG